MNVNHNQPPHGQSRRAFIKTTGTGILAASVWAGCAGSGGPKQEGHESRQAGKNPMTTPGVALQLYTVRNEIEQDTEGTLRRVAELGFHHVETAFWPKDVSAAQAAGLLREYGLKPVAAHIELPASSESRKAFLEAARNYDCTRMIWHGWPEDPRYQTTEGTKELIRLYREASRFAQDNGLTFGLHNHWWEFRNSPGDKRVFDHWMEGLDDATFLELDTYWIKVAGYDPAQVIGEAGERVKFIHLKDGPARWHEQLAQDNPDPMTAIGKGVQDIPAIINASRAHVEWIVVEMDKVEGDVFEVLSDSLHTLNVLLDGQSGSQS